MVPAALIRLLTGEPGAPRVDPGPRRDSRSSSIHAALIMDGNGRWASERKLPRSAGHRAGATRIRPLVEAAPELGISDLTLFAFSVDNWNRPEHEVRGILDLLADYLHKEVDRCVESGVRVRVLGRRDRIPAHLAAAIEAAERATRSGSNLTLRLAVDYSGREALVDVFRDMVARGAASGAELTAEGLPEAGDGAARDLVAPDVDLLIRTGGEQRLSDFLLWECAYAEFIFTETLWPDFAPQDLAAAVAEFRCRDRRFGRVPQQVDGPGSAAAPKNDPPKELAG